MKKKNRKQSAQKEQHRPLSRKKKIVFSIITLSIPILFLVLLEVFLRMGNYRGDQSLFIFPERFGGAYGMLNHHYHEKFFFRTTTFTAGRGDVFLREKPENAFRVFVLGASTTESFPYGYNGMFSLVIRDMLEDVLPDRHVEVINLGITATNTYALYDQTREILKYEPDAILIYSGQNEYYGALGIASAEMIGRNPAFVRTYMILYRYRTFLMLRDAMGWVMNRLTGYDMHEAPGTLMQRLAQQHSIPLDSDIYEAGKRQFADNLEKILQRFEDHDVPVFISSLVSNLKDHPPFYSVETDNYPGADEIFERALREYSSGNFDDAFQSFRYARDLDALRFRAPSAMNEIIREKAGAFNAFYVPMKEKMSGYAENGIIGSDLMLEHLHPNSEGYFLMGKTFFEGVAEADIPGLQPDMSRLKSPEEYREAMFLTELDERMVWHRVQALMNSWPFVDEPDSEGYPANYTPESELDRLAINHVNEHISWEEAKTTMARWYSQNGMHHEAILEIKGALRAVPYEEEAWRFAGWLAREGDRLEEAFDFYKQAFEIRPTNNASRNLGMILIDMENYIEGAGWLQEAFRLDRGDHNSLFNASVAYASAEEYQRALDVADQMHRINPNYRDIQMWRMHLLSRID
jgi:tetratricopeptide (TPR) repeat protein